MTTSIFRNFDLEKLRGYSDSTLNELTESFGDHFAILIYHLYGGCGAERIEETTIVQLDRIWGTKDLSNNELAALWETTRERLSQVKEDLHGEYRTHWSEFGFPDGESGGHNYIIGSCIATTHQDYSQENMLSIYLLKHLDSIITRSSDNSLNLALMNELLSIYFVYSEMIELTTATLTRAVERAKSSKRARENALVRNLPNKRIKEYALHLFDEKKWQSSLDAAKKITPMVNEFCDENKIPRLSKDRITQTIYEWILASQK